MRRAVKSKYGLWVIFSMWHYWLCSPPCFPSQWDGVHLELLSETSCLLWDTAALPLPMHLLLLMWRVENYQPSHGIGAPAACGCCCPVLLVVPKQLHTAAQLKNCWSQWQPRCHSVITMSTVPHYSVPIRIFVCLCHGIWQCVSSMRFFSPQWCLWRALSDCPLCRLHSIMPCECWLLQLCVVMLSGCTVLHLTDSLSWQENGK